MTSPLRAFAYKNRWFYNTIKAIAALSVGGIKKLDQLAYLKINKHLLQGDQVLDLCCGSGETSQVWIDAGFKVTGLDVSKRILEIAKAEHPQLNIVEGFAESPPLIPGKFSVVQICLALHEFNPLSREKVIQSSFQMLEPGGILVIVDLHEAETYLKIPQQVFCFLFETKTALQLLKTNLPKQLLANGFCDIQQDLIANKSLQTITAKRPKRNLM